MQYGDRLGRPHRKCDEKLQRKKPDFLASCNRVLKFRPRLKKNILKNHKKKNCVQNNAKIVKVENCLKGSLIPSPSTSVKIQIMGGKVLPYCLK